MGRGTLWGMVALGLLLLAGAVAPQLRTAAGDAAPSSAVERAAPAGLVAVAGQAAARTGASADVLLAISEVECDFGRCRAGQPDSAVPADLRLRVDVAALGPGGETARLLGVTEGRRIGDWVDPIPVGGQHAMGFMQFLPSTWRVESRAAPGRPRDPYRPLDAMVTAGSYLQRLRSGAVDGRSRSLRSALAVYGGDDAYASRVLALTAV